MDDAENGHPRSIMRELEARDAPPEMVLAIATHADYLGVPRESDMEKTLAAVDELSGFLVACAAVRPEGINGDRKSTRLNSSHANISYAVFCLKKIILPTNYLTN